MEWHFSKGFDQEFHAVSIAIVSATTAVYKSAVANLLPTPEKSHYLFNLRDFGRVIQGTLLVKQLHFGFGNIIMLLHRIHSLKFISST